MTNPSVRSGIARDALVPVLTTLIAAGNIVMIGPQVVLIVPLALVIGLVFALRRSFWSLVCFGYPFTFGLTSAWIGYNELPGYERSPAFAISVGVGLLGVVLVAVGLWKVLPVRQVKQSDGIRH